MNQRIWLNVAMNFVLAVVFVLLNQWALRNQLEETFVTLAIFYGCIVIVGNALYISSAKGA
jgi:hypothetical protein